jgi:putative component of membrane protein insertase Oxa1/YidC/SpoIIIJ protein YidD
LKKTQLDGVPTQWEQDVAEAYVLERPLDRPDININKAIFEVLVYCVLLTVLTLGLWFLIDRFDILIYFPRINQIYNNHPTTFFLLLDGGLLVVSVMILLRSILIGLIKLYQHYAHESVRRRCLFMPTCSEYAILALRKYGVLRSLPMIYDRLFKRCQGDTYRIDYP